MQAATPSGTDFYDTLAEGVVSRDDSLSSAGRENLRKKAADFMRGLDRELVIQALETAGVETS